MTEPKWPEAPDIKSELGQGIEKLQRKHCADHGISCGCMAPKLCALKVKKLHDFEEGHEVILERIPDSPASDR